MGCDPSLISSPAFKVFQSTHPCGVRLIKLVTNSSLADVSIHAPVWGATLVINRVNTFKQVSIHAPVWGATQRWPRQQPRQCFNPRTRVGCDCGSCCSKRSDFGFNPRTRVGCDVQTDMDYKRQLVSIHAPVWGATIKIIAHRLP